MIFLKEGLREVRKRGREVTLLDRFEVGTFVNRRGTDWDSSTETYTKTYTPQMKE